MLDASKTEVTRARLSATAYATPQSLNDLRLALNKIEPGGLADQQIGGKV